MISALMKLWGLTDDCTDEQWQDAYQMELFKAKKELRSNISLPKVFNSKCEKYQQWASYENPNVQWPKTVAVNVKDFGDYEFRLSSQLSVLEKCEHFTELVMVAKQLFLLLEAYKKLVEELTIKWGDDWQQVQVNSREIFPSGMFSYSLKNGKTLDDWKLELLKERKRLTIIF